MAGEELNIDHDRRNVSLINKFTHRTQLHGTGSTKSQRAPMSWNRSLGRQEQKEVNFFSVLSCMSFLPELRSLKKII